MCWKGALPCLLVETGMPSTKWQKCAGEKGQMWHLNGKEGKNGLFLDLEQRSMKLSTYAMKKIDYLKQRWTLEQVLQNRSGSRGCQGLTVLRKSSLKVQRISSLLETAEEGNVCFLCTSWSSHIGDNRTFRSSPLLLQHLLPLYIAKLCLKVLRPIKLHEWFCGFYCSVFLL